MEHRCLQSHIKNAKGNIFRTDILDEYSNCLIESLNTTNTNDKMMYRVIDIDKTFLLKVIKCDRNDKKSIKDIKTETIISKNNKIHSLELIRCKDYNDENSTDVHFEMLHKYDGQLLADFIYNVDGNQVFELARQSLDSIITICDQTHFHININPENLLVRAGSVVIIDFGITEGTHEKMVELTDCFENERFCYNIVDRKSVV